MENFSATRIFRCLLLGVLLFILNPDASAQYFPPPYEVEALFNNDIVPIVDISWEHDADSVLYFEVRRDGWGMVATTTDHFYTDNPPDFLNYCYTVSAVYNGGSSDPSGSSCTMQQLYPEMEIHPDFLEYNVDTNDSITYFYGVLNVGEAHLWYRSLGFTDTTSPAGFVSIDGWSSGWNAPGGGLLNVPVEMNSTGYGPGTYSQDLVVVGNDPDNPAELIPCIMNVGPNVTITGTITDFTSLDSLAGVEVGGAAYFTQTDLNGYYSLKVPPNTSLDVYIVKPGYETQMLPVFTGDAGTVITLDKSLYSTPERVPWVLAETDCNDPAPAYVSWGYPEVYDEIVYDNNFCREYFAWEEPLGEHALKFTPKGYPSEIIGGSFYVGQGIYPEGNWLGSQVAVLVYDEGSDGMPGNQLDSVGVTINNYGWVEFPGTDAIIDSGDFFISIAQQNHLPYSPPIGIHYGLNENRSYSKPPGGTFGISAQQNFMIRAYVEFPSDEEVVYYTVSRISDFNPDLGPQVGTNTVLANLTDTSAMDNSFPSLPEGWYAYAIQTFYTDGQASQWTYSNIIGMHMGRIVEFFAVDCLGNPVDSLEIMMWGLDYPYEQYSNTDTTYNGFDCVMKGHYDIDVLSPGYTLYNFEVFIENDTSFYLVLDQALHPPQNLWVDSLTCMAFWNVPEDTTLLEKYYIYLDGILLDSTQNTYYNYDSLGYGETFTSCIEVKYPCGSSEQLCIEFTSGYVGPGTDLPLSEGFDSGSFGTFWMADENWLVNGQFGNPAPGAEFSWYPMMANYESSLTSGPMNGIYRDSTKQEYVDGRFMLVYDIALEDNGMSGTEYLFIDVMSEGEWSTLAEHNNVSGSFDWETFELDITEQALGQVFYIRFRCAGEETSNILSWFIDNIEVYHYCAPPTSLCGEQLNEVSIELYWSPPAIIVSGAWIHWDDGMHSNNAIGYDSAAVWSVAARFEPESLAGFGGYFITHLRFIPGYSSNASTFQLKIWEGANAANLLYSEDLTNVLLGDWNEIELTSPVAIDTTKELWIGYTIEQFTADDYPAGVDAGPAVANYGDLLTIDGINWESMSLVYGLDYNWSLQAYVDDITDGVSGTSNLLVENTEYRKLNNTPGLKICSSANSAVGQLTVGDRMLTGYNIYWNEDGSGYNFLEFTEDTTYIHVVEDPFVNGTIQCYYVTAVYDGCEPESNEACFLIHGIEDIFLKAGIIVYPNPSSNELTIQSDYELDHLCLLDLRGRIMTCREEIQEKSINLDVSTYEPGIYLLRINIGTQSYNRKIVIAK